jgi:hypothetical protein
MPLNRLASRALEAALVAALAITLAVALSACADRDDLDADRPASLTGLWVGRSEGAGGPDSVALTLARDASASVRRWTAPQSSVRFDSTAHYALWKVTGSADDRGVTICLHLATTGANDCIPIRARGGDSLRLAFPTRPAAPGAVVDVTLHRVAQADSTAGR